MRLSSESELKQLLKNKHVKVRNNSSVQASNRKQIIGNDLAGKKKIKGFDRQVSIKIRSYRHRLCDPFGISEKYAIDSIVDIGILQDDSCKEICEEKSNHRQIKIKKSESEKTVITIESV